MFGGRRLLILSTQVVTFIFLIHLMFSLILLMVLDEVQIMHDIYYVMEELASLPKNIPTYENVVGNEIVIEDEWLK